MESININKDVFQNLDDTRKSKLREKIGNGELSINIIDNPISPKEEEKPQITENIEDEKEVSFFNKVKDFGKTYVDNVADTFVGARPFKTEDTTKELKNKVFDKVLGGLGGEQEVETSLKIENPNYKELEIRLKDEIKADTENENKKIEDNLIQDIENLSRIDTRLIGEATQEQKDKYLDNISTILGKGGYALGQKEDGNYVAIDKDGNEKDIKNDLWESILDGIKADAGELAGAIYGAKKGVDLSKNMKNPLAKIATIAGSSMAGSVAGTSLDMGINRLKNRENLGIENILNELSKSAVLDLAGNAVAAGVIKIGGKIIEIPKTARDYFFNGNIQGAREILKKDLGIDEQYIEDALIQMKQNYKESENYANNIASEDSSTLSKVTSKIGGSIRNQIGQQEELLAATLEKGDANIIKGAISSNETAARNLADTIDKRTSTIFNELENKSSKVGGEEIKNFLNSFENTTKQNFSNMRKDFNEAFKDIEYKFELEDLNLNSTFKDMAKRVQDPDAKKRFETLQKAIKNTIYDSNAQVGIERDINGLLDTRQQLNRFYGQNERFLTNKKDKDTFNALKENIDNQIYKAVNDNLPPELGTRLIDSFSKSLDSYRQLGNLQDNKVFNAIMGDAQSPEFRMDKLVKHMADDDSYVDDVLSKMTPQARQTVEVAVLREITDSYTAKTAQGQKAIAFEDLGKELAAVKRNVRSELGKETIDNLIAYADKFGNRDLMYLDMAKGIATKPKHNIATTLEGKIKMETASMLFSVFQTLKPGDNAKRLALQRHIGKALERSRTPNEFMTNIYEYPDLSDNSRQILKSMIKNNNKIISAKNEEEAQKLLDEAKVESQKIIDNENKLKFEIENFKTPDIYELRTVSGLTPDDKFGSFSQLTTKIQKGNATQQEIEQYIKARNNIKAEDLEKNILKLKYPINSTAVSKLEELQNLNKARLDEVVNADEYKALIYNLNKDQLPNTTKEIEDKYRQKFYELNKIYDEEKALQEKARAEAEKKAFEDADKNGAIPFAKFSDNLLAGTLAGVETDEDGNIVGFNPEDFVIGLGGYTVAKQSAKYLIDNYANKIKQPAFTKLNNFLDDAENEMAKLAGGGKPPAIHEVYNKEKEAFINLDNFVKKFRKNHPNLKINYEKSKKSDSRYLSIHDDDNVIFFKERYSDHRLPNSSGTYTHPMYYADKTFAEFEKDILKDAREIISKKIKILEDDYKFGLGTKESFEREMNTLLKQKDILDNSNLKDYKDSQGFYSVLEKTIDEKVGGKIDSISLAKVLEKNGVKQDELEWSGLKDLLDSKDKLTKEEIENTIKENRLVLEKISFNAEQDFKKELVLDYNDLDDEVLDYLNSLDNKTKKIAEDMMVEFDRDKLTDGTYDKQWDELTTKYPKLDHNIIHDVGDALKDEAFEKHLNRKFPKYQDYKIDGGKNYKEILFRTPNKQELKLGNDIKIIDGGDGYFYAETAPFNGTNVITGAKTKKQLEAEIKKGYKSNHWDESNIVVFTRVDDRTIDNKKTLFIEELQSDWHQDGRKKGYGDKKSQVPDAPFKKNWHELGLKRMIQEAVENDYEKIAWTTGKQQAQRYSLEKEIDTVIYNKQSGYLQASKDGDEVIFKKVASDEEVANLLGKEITNRLIDPKQSTRENIFVLQGEDVKFGGEGMKAFYDEIIPNSAKKLFKKYNVKPKLEELDDLEEMVWSVEITLKMKEDIKKYGQPLYAIGGALAIGNELSNNGDNDE